MKLKMNAVILKSKNHKTLLCDINFFSKSVVLRNDSKLYFKLSFIDKNVCVVCHTLNGLSRIIFISLNLHHHVLVDQYLSKCHRSTDKISCTQKYLLFFFF